jgi:hypothetical protein
MPESMPRLVKVTPTVLLQLEGLALLALCCTAYQHFFPHRWLRFTVLFLLPDLSLLGYLTRSPRFAAALYNSVHTSSFPLALGIGSYLWSSSIGLAVSLIWLAHISLDRGLGYGLKFAEGFQPTHIQRAGVWRDEEHQ